MKKKEKRQVRLEPKKLTKRPPVVVLLGHVDHGKTALLSALAKIDLTKKEFGGISQHTNAYQIFGPENSPITFIDTPGHELFAKMRSRGAKVADLALLVIAANEGIKPQTKESLNYIQKAKLPFFVVINKMDLPAADPMKVKSQLAKEGVLVEDLKGDIVSLEISAKTKKGLEELLEMILLFTELEEIKAETEASLGAVVIESTLDPKKGPLATLLVKKGTISSGKEIFAGKAKARVRAIFDDQGKRINQLGPGEAGRILGFSKTLRVGRLITDEPKEEKRGRPLIKREEKDRGKLKIILKADVLGTLQAIEENLPKGVEIIDKGVGAVNESDVLNASTSEATIIAFNTQLSKSVKELARTEKVKMTSFQVIYELLDWLLERMEKKKKAKAKEKIKGKAEIIAEFKVEGLKIAGAKILSGEMAVNDKVKLEREKKLIKEGKIKSIKHKKKAVEKARAGKEYGFSFEPELDFRQGDMIISYSENTKEENEKF